MHSIRTRLSLWFFCGSGLVALPLCLGGWLLAREVVMNGLDRELRGRGESLAAMCRHVEGTEELAFDWPPDLKFSTLLGRDPAEFEVWQVYPRRLLYRSASELSTYGTNEVLAGGPVKRVSRARYRTMHSEDDVPRRFAVVLVTVPEHDEADPKARDREVEAIVRISVNMSPEQLTLNMILAIIGGIGLLSALLLAAISQLLATRFTAPVIALAEATKRAHLEEVPAFPRSARNDEFDLLAEALSQSFSQRRDALQRHARFTSDAAHELRSPLASMRSSAEVALRRERESEDYERFFRETLGTLDRMENTVQALLELARLDRRVDVEREFEAVDLRTVLADVLTHFFSKQQERIQVRPENQEPFLVHGQARLLGILIENLLRNALQYSPEDSPVEVLIAREQGDISCTVRDFGMGIEAEDQERVFERFYRSPASSVEVAGSGLGLSIARAIAEVHGAELSLVPGHPGTRATLRLRAAVST